MMKRFRRNTSLLMAALLAACCLNAAAETAADEVEQGVEEIQALLEVTETEVRETDGMSLEEMTEAVTDSAMSEYVDAATGFTMQYPSSFQFDEGGSSSYAVTADGKASLYIESVLNEGALNEETLVQAIRLEIPDAEPQKNEQNGCLRFDRTTDSGSVEQTDLYYLTENSLHHIVIRYPAVEKETYDAYISYMINSMETGDSDLG